MNRTTNPRLERKLAEAHTSGGTFIAAVWVVFYLVAIALAMQPPFVVNAMQVAGRY
ncbi:MAG: hypothetical protein WBD48_16245 [Pseudolabrys sp.]|jgi:hypothetical protein